MNPFNEPYNPSGTPYGEPPGSLGGPPKDPYAGMVKWVFIFMIIVMVGGFLFSVLTQRYMMRTINTQLDESFDRGQQFDNDLQKQINDQLKKQGVDTTQE